MPLTGTYNYKPNKKGMMLKSVEIGQLPNEVEYIGEMYTSKGYSYLFNIPLPKKSAKCLRIIADKRNFVGISVIDFI